MELVDFVPFRLGQVRLGWVRLGSQEGFCSLELVDFVPFRLGQVGLGQVLKKDSVPWSYLAWFREIKLYLTGTKFKLCSFVIFDDDAEALISQRRF